MPSSRPAPPMAPRGPLPARVYWFRRLVVLGVAVLLVAGLARLLGGSSDASSDEDAQATTAGATTSTSADAGRDRRDRGPDRAGRGAEAQEEAADPDRAAAGRADAAPARTATSSPRPTITEAPGGSDVPITLNLRTRGHRGLHLDGVARTP